MNKLSEKQKDARRKNVQTGGPGAGGTPFVGVTLGNHVVAASGAVVTKSFGDKVVIAGNPAKVIRTI
nr:hypothetical protein [Microbulbifer sp. YPW1]